jgi:XapX domain-containing protein
MRTYLLSFGAGVLVGIVYSVLQVRSPAPPIIALLGLLGILLGEQVIPVGRQLLAGASLPAACARSEVSAHLLGRLPGRSKPVAHVEAGAEKES